MGIIKQTIFFCCVVWWMLGLMSMLKNITVWIYSDLRRRFEFRIWIQNVADSSGVPTWGWIWIPNTSNLIPQSRRRYCSSIYVLKLAKKSSRRYVVEQARAFQQEWSEVKALAVNIVKWSPPKWSYVRKMSKNIFLQYFLIKQEDEPNKLTF